MTEIFLKDLEAWDGFLAIEGNREAVESQYGSVEKAYKHACDGGLELGGGAQALFVIFIDDGEGREPL